MGFSCTFHDETNPTRTAMKVYTRANLTESRSDCLDCCFERSRRRSSRLILKRFERSSITSSCGAVLCHPVTHKNIVLPPPKAPSNTTYFRVKGSRIVGDLMSLVTSSALSRDTQTLQDARYACTSR